MGSRRSALPRCSGATGDVNSQAAPPHPSAVAAELELDHMTINIMKATLLVIPVCLLTLTVIAAETSKPVFQARSFTGHCSLGIGHWSLVIGHWSLVIGHWSLVIGHRLSILQQPIIALCKVARRRIGHGHSISREDIGGERDPVGQIS